MAIIFEIAITVFLVTKLIEAQKAVLVLQDKLLFSSKVFMELTKSLTVTVKKVNKVVSVFTNKNFIRVANILKITLSVVQVIILVKSLKFSSNMLSNAKAIKRLIYTQIFKGVIKYLCKCL